ncbi:MAG: hypothetical protein SFX18_07250 [Pirellulales bacterium]|nr:hypothetical protein [Pirellulales bacterium]
MSTLTLTPAGKVLAWKDKATGLVFSAPDEDRAPQYLANSPLGPAVYFEPIHYLKATIADWMTTQGQIGMNVHWLEQSSETFPLSSADEQSNSKYTMFYTRQVGPNYRFGMRMRNQPDVPAFNGGIEADGSSLQLDTNYSLNIRAHGTGGTSSYELWGNGINYPPTYGSNAAMLNSWMGSIPGRDNLILGAFQLQDSVQQTGKFYIGQAVAFSSPLNNQQNAEFQEMLLTIGSTPIPEPGNGITYITILASLSGWLLRQCKRNI